MAARAGILHEALRPPAQRRPAVAPAIITREGERALGAERARLQRQLEVDFVDRLKQARDFGETGSNDDYLQIKEEEAVVTSRILRLESLLDSAAVVDEPDPAPGAVAIGAIVEVEDAATGELREHRITGGYERLGPDDVSASSPMGRALLGRAKGEDVAVALPDGRQRTLKITAVRAPDRG